MFRHRGDISSGDTCSELSVPSQGILVHLMKFLKHMVAVFNLLHGAFKFPCGYGVTVDTRCRSLILFRISISTLHMLSEKQSGSRMVAIVYGQQHVTSSLDNKVITFSYEVQDNFGF